MKLYNTWVLLVLAFCWSNTAPAQLQLLPVGQPQLVFAGSSQKITVIWHNATNEPTTAEIHSRLYLASSSTAVPVEETLWKTLQVLPHQTVMESAGFDFPKVRAETKFVVQWLQSTNHVLGATEVRVFPVNLLAELKPLVEDQSLGVFDPLNQLKPLLKNLDVDFVDLGNSELVHFPGKLAIIGPFESLTQVPNDLARRIKMLARKGVAVVWLLPPEPGETLQPSFYLVPEGRSVVVVAQTALVSDLPANPQSQLNLISLCNLALHPQFLTLPDLSTQP